MYIYIEMVISNSYYDVISYFIHHLSNWDKVVNLWQVHSMLAGYDFLALSACNELMLCCGHLVRVGIP